MSEITTVFLSSTFNDLKDYRKELIEFFDGLDSYKCICMEKFGARDRESDEFCRARVAESDIFVGIIGHVYGSCLSNGQSYTEREYNTAVELEKPCLMFLAPHDFLVPADLVENDDGKRTKLRQLRARVENERIRATFKTPDELVSAVNRALSNLKNEKRSSVDIELRSNTLNDLQTASQARCIRRLVATGLPEEQAKQWIEDNSFGLPGTWLFKHMHNKRIIITGEIGSGKSLIAERLHQMAVSAAISDSNAPIPIYLAEATLKSAATDLKAAIRNASKYLGEPGIAGISLILDGLDECGNDTAISLLDAARDVSLMWSNSQIVMTSRSTIPELEHLTEQEIRLNVPSLTDDEAAELINRCIDWEYSKYNLYSLDKSVRDAVHFPLFALLFGTFTRDNIMVPKSEGEMISFVVERALRGVSANVGEALPLLSRLGCECVKRHGRIPTAELGSRSQIQHLLDSRLTVEDAGMLSFALPLFHEWFAAQALAEKMISPDDLSNSPCIDRWLAPLAVLTASADNDTVSHYLAPIAEKYPHIAAAVVRNGVAKRDRLKSVELPPPIECGRRIRTSMQAWANGLGSLAQLIAPVDESGIVYPVGVCTDSDMLSVGWHCGNNLSEDVFEVDAKTLFSRSMPEGFLSIKCSSTSDQPTWAWQWTHDELVRKLAGILQERKLPVTTVPMAYEAAWETATKLCASYKGFEQPISLSDIENEMSDIETMFPGHEKVFLDSMNIPYEAAPLKAEVDRLRAIGETQMNAPWQGPDAVPESTIIAGYPWQFYSEEALLNRTKQVYTAALDVYKRIVEEWFPKFSNRLKVYVIMPVRLVGILDAPCPGQGFEGSPVLNWHFEALPKGEENHVSIDYGSRPSNPFGNWEAMRDSIQKNRSGIDWLQASFHQGILEVFGTRPATNIAYEWLWDDLKAISWVDGTFSRNRY